MSAASSPPHRAAHWAFAGLLLVLAYTAHAPGLRAPFLFDDFPYVLEDPHLRSLRLPWAFARNNTRPVLYFTLAADFAAHGTDPAGFHRTNLWIHLLSALLLFGILRRTLRRVPAWREGLAPAVLAFFAAALWAAHPLHANTIAYVWQRGESLMALFYLLTLYAFLRGTEPGGSRNWLALSLLACLLGMGTKEVMATAPLAVLLYDRAFVAGSFGEALRRRWRFHAALFATWFLLGGLLLASRTSYHVNPGVGFGSSIYSPAAYALTMPGVHLHYLRLAFFPVGLCLDRNWPIAASLSAESLRIALWSAVFLGTLAAAAWRPRWGYGALWFFLVLSVSSGIMPMPDPVFEYRMILPLAGLAGLAVAFLYGAAELACAAWTDDPAAARRGALGYVACVGGLALIALLFLARARETDFRSRRAIWADTLQKRPDNLRALVNLWRAARDADAEAETVRRYETILERDPLRLDALVFLGKAALERHDPHGARRLLERATRVDPAAALAWYHLGLAREGCGQAAAAAVAYRRTLALKPLFAQAHLALARLQMRNGDFAGASEHLAEAIRIWPQWAKARAARGELLWTTGDAAGAVAAYEEASRLAPGHAPYHIRLAELYERTGEERKARHRIRWALRIDPERADWIDRMARILLREGDVRQAVWYWKQAVELAPRDAGLHTRLGAALCLAGEAGEGMAHLGRAVALQPGNATAQFNLALALEHKAVYATAAAHYAWALEARPGWGAAHLHLGICLERLGRTAEAAAQYRKAIGLLAEPAEAERRLRALNAADPNGASP